MPDRLKVVLCWHMHQPIYYNPSNGEYQLPWTYLHGIKDYVDMAAHLEAVPRACAVVNFVPTLLEQLDDYVHQVQTFLAAYPSQPHKEGGSSEESSSPVGKITSFFHLRFGTKAKEEASSSKEDVTNFIRDPTLAALVSNPPHFAFMQRGADDYQARLLLIEQCLRANKEHMIQPFKAYRQLVSIADWINQNPEMVMYVGDQYLVDLVMWYHLAWLGETVHRDDDRVKALMKKGQRFDYHERRLMLEIVGELLASIIPRYAALCAKGQVELSFTPYAHPIAPLMVDANSAREALPNIRLPHLSGYHDGTERIRWHIQQGMASFKKYLGVTPFGCWPAEGSVSDAVVRLIGECGIRWVASGENVLRNSLRKSHQEQVSIHHPFHLSGNDVYCFFRDDTLSDLIGFEYSKWHADDAVSNLIHRLEAIAREAQKTGAQVISIIMDGENAWEFYPYNAYYFLHGLYQKLANHPQLELTTFSRCLDLHAQELPALVAGSWVYGTFSTWIGDKDKNRAWEMLDDVKRAFDRAIDSLDPKKRAMAEHQLAICEGSDWCWWFGDYNPSDTVRDFDRLYRLHLRELYQLLGEPPPDYLQHTFSYGGGDPAASGVMRRGQHD